MKINPEDECNDKPTVIVRNGYSFVVASFADCDFDMYLYYFYSHYSENGQRHQNTKE